MNLRAARLVATLAALVLVPLVAAAQFDDSQQNVPPSPPPPLPPEQPPEDAEQYRPLIPSRAEHDDVPWGLDDSLMEELQRKAEVYKDYARRFTCDETARTAQYDEAGRAGEESVREYAYLLVSDPAQATVRESRRTFTRTNDRRPRGGEIDDREPFPPAYTWVFLFSDVHEGFFDYRLIDKRFEGFDLVLEIQFRGSMPFTDGRDIRQWEGTVLLDAFNYRPLQVVAEPRDQTVRIEQLYRAWAGSSSILGFRTKKTPLGYRAQVEFRHFRSDLSFPTELRYDTFRAVSPTQVVPVRASTRTYRDYLFYEVTPTRQELGDVVGEN